MCSTDLIDAPWDVDAKPGYGPGASMDDSIPVAAPRQGEIPAEYRDASADELNDRIIRAKEKLGDRVVILGHHYQRVEVVEHADYIGDSFMLAKAAQNHPEAEAIVFAASISWPRPLTCSPHPNSRSSCPTSRRLLDG